MTYVFRAESEFPSACDEQADEGQGGVKQQELVAETVVPQERGEVVEGGTYHRGDDSNVGDGAVVRPSAGVEAEAEESQQRTIGVAGYGVDCIKHAWIVQRFEGKDTQHEYGDHQQMHTLA